MKGRVRAMLALSINALAALMTLVMNDGSGHSCGITMPMRRVMVG